MAAGVNMTEGDIGCDRGRSLALGNMTCLCEGSKGARMPRASLVAVQTFDAMTKVAIEQEQFDVVD
jgi:hypothetical protein